MTYESRKLRRGKNLKVEDIIVKKEKVEPEKEAAKRIR